MHMCELIPGLKYYEMNHFFELRMKISEGERDIRCRMNSLSGWKKQPEQIQAWPEMEPLPLRWLDATLYPLS